MTPKMQKKRDEMADNFKLNQECICDDPNMGTCFYHLTKEEQERYGFSNGFNAAHDLMLEEIKPLVEALDYLSKLDTELEPGVPLRRISAMLNVYKAKSLLALAHFKERFGEDE